MLYDNIYYPF